MTFIRRLFGRAERDGEGEPRPDVAPPPEAATASRPRRPPPQPARQLPACPYCAIVLDPPPERNRLCPSCRQPIIVRRVDGRLVLLPDAALPVFERERNRTADEARWLTEREGWLKLAETVNVPVAKRSKLARADLSAASVAEARELYLSGAEAAVRTARRGKRWSEVALIRRAQASALYREAGGSPPPSPDVVELHREGMLAELRSMAELSGHAELVGAGCCPACRANDGKVFPIAAELASPRLPHEACPKGLCGCDWWIAMVAPKPPRKKRPRKAAAAPPSGTNDAAAADAPEPVTTDGDGGAASA